MDPVSINIFEQINQICKEFRRECRNGTEPDIADWLQRVPKSSQANLLQNLLDVEVNYRRSRGGVPNSEEYLERFPQFARLIRQAFFEDTMMSMADPMQDTPAIDSADFASPGVSFDSLVHQQAAFTPIEMPAARRIGEYELLRELGRGGMGVVYEAKHLQRQNHVALKTLPTGVDGQEVNAERLHKFRNEFRSLSEINHPNLVGMQTLEVDGGQWFFTMDLIIGRDFLSFVRPDDQLDQQRLRQTLKQLATGIIFLHECGIVHRDLKPSNVLVDETGRVILLDFGLVAQLQQSTDKSASMSTANFAGTPRYAAPEQMFGERTKATDWYALGTMIYEALTGGPPFTGQPMEVLKQKQTKDSPALANSDSRPADLARLADGLLKRKPDQRPTAAEVIEILGIDLDSSSCTFTRKSIGPTHSSIDDGIEIDSATKNEFYLVGRNSQLNQLHIIQQEFLANRAPMATWISGLSGEGKSTLAVHFLRSLEEQGDILVFSGRCYDREAVPYKAIDCWIDSLVAFLRRLPDEVANQYCSGDLYLLAHIFPALFRVKAIADRTSRGIDGVEDRQIRFRAFAALRQLLGAVGASTPIVIFIDDLQWGDAASAEVFNDFLSSAHAPFTMLLGSFRSDEAEQSPFLNCWNKFFHNGLAQRTVKVGPFDEKMCAEILIRRLGVDEDVAVNQASELFQRSHGNPYFVERLLEGYNTVKGSIEEIPLREIIRRKLLQLPQGSEELLHAVSVAGQSVESSEVLSVAGRSREGYGLLTHMRNERLIRLIHGHGSLKIDTYHDKIREETLEYLEDQKRRALHLDFAELIERAEQLEASKLLSAADENSLAYSKSHDFSNRITDLAFHFGEAQDPRAFAYKLVAAEHAHETYATDAAGVQLEGITELVPADASQATNFRMHFAIGQYEKRSMKSIQAEKSFTSCLNYAQTPNQKATTLMCLATSRDQMADFPKALKYYYLAAAQLGYLKPRTKVGTVARILQRIIVATCVPIHWHNKLDEQSQFRCRFFMRLFQLMDGCSNEASSQVSMDVFLNNLNVLYYSNNSVNTDHARVGHVRAIAICYFAGLRFLAKMLHRRYQKLPASQASPELRAQEAFCRGIIHECTFESDSALMQYENAGKVFTDCGMHTQALVASTFARNLLMWFGVSSQELKAANAVLDYADLLHEDRSRSWGLFGIANAAARSGNLGKANHSVQTALRYIAGRGFRTTEPLCRGTCGYVLLQCSEYRRASEQLRLSWVITEENGSYFGFTVVYLPLLMESICGHSWTQVVGDRDIQNELRLRLKQAGKKRAMFSFLDPYLQRGRGRAFASLGKNKQAVRCFESAVKCAREQKMRYALGKSLLDLAAVKRDESDENRAEAIELLKEMESVIPRAESWLLGDQYDEAVVAPEFDLAAWERDNGPINRQIEDAE